MPYLMIHDIRRDYFDLTLNDFLLSFDDGLFSQYYYYPLFRKHPHPLTYFITTAFVRPGPARSMYDGRHSEFIKSKKYMYRTFIQNDYSHFMTVEELQDLAARPGVRIGVHSHAHDVIPTATHARKPKPPSPWKQELVGHAQTIAAKGLSIRSKLAFRGFDLTDGTLRRRSAAAWQDYVKRDTEHCLRWMARHLKLAPDSYCFPFNEYTPDLIDLLKPFGFKHFFAARAQKSAAVTPRTDIDRLLPA